MSDKWVIVYPGIPGPTVFGSTKGAGSPLIIDALTDTPYYYKPGIGVTALAGGGGGGGVWGAITGTLASQIDLVAALATKEPADPDILKVANIGVNVAAFPTGTPDGSKYLRDDNSWQPVPGGGLSQAQILARGLGA